MARMGQQFCILAIHGHPDDETINLGGTIARYAAAGARVVCATATRGDLGEIVDPSSSSAENHDRLGELRMEEMSSALAILGHVEARWLGYRDSGMADDPRSSDPEAFCRADPNEAAGRIAQIIREIRPQIVITHRSEGADGHPDHRFAAMAARMAFERAGDERAWPEQLVGPNALEPWTPSKLYETHGRTHAPLGQVAKLRHLVRDLGLVAALPVIARAALRPLTRRGRAPTSVGAGRPEPTTRIDIGPWVAARDAAIRAFRTQVAPTDPLLRLSPRELRTLSPTENFTLLVSPVWMLPEDDLVAGLDTTDAEPASIGGHPA